MTTRGDRQLIYNTAHCHHCIRSFLLSAAYLLWKICHDVVEALPGEKVLVKFVLLSSHVLREGLRPTQHLKQIYA